jgi:hypothetical protein
VTVDLERQTVKDAPTYNPLVPFPRESEATIYGHYSRHPYWSETASREFA